MSIQLPKIFLDSGDPEETKKAKGLISHIDGQTTNPSLVAKNPEVQKVLSQGKKLSEKDLMSLYKQSIQEIEKEISGPISVEVFADWKTPATSMLKQAEDMFNWGRNIYIKFPTIPEGVKAAHEFVKKGGRVNMTLVFDQKQAAAVYAATLPASQPSFISPFIGRWDDRGYRGLDLVKNILKMYKKFDKKLNHKKSHVEVLAASIRTTDHLYASIFMGADIVTIPMKVIEKWLTEEKWIPDSNYRIESTGLKSLIYEDLQLSQNFEDFKIEQDENSLLNEGLTKFIADWNNLIGK